LDGNVATTPTEHIIQILVPGITNTSALSFKFEGWNSILVSVVLPSLFPVSKKNEQTTKESFSRMEIRGGKAIFRHTFPGELPFRRPGTAEELNSMIDVEGGILTINLPREQIISNF